MNGSATHSCAGPFEHLLCCVDGSAPACRAAEWAALLASTLNARLTFLVVAPEGRATYELDRYLELEGIVGASLPVVSVKAERCLDIAMRNAHRVGVPNSATRIMTGKIVPAICQTARSIGADRIVLGRHRRATLSIAFRSSVARSVGDGCNYPVLSIG